jgi:soluble lytic murein transglycosylase
MFDEAVAEYTAGKNTTSDPALPALYTLADQADRSLALVEPLWKPPADYQIDVMPREAARLFYPAPYRTQLIDHSASRNVDPRFLLAIMRQESRFATQAKSVSAARGMMQFTATTARKTAAELGRTSIDQDSLYDPSTAILFGSHYIKKLFDLFPRQPAAVAASYNGGEDNMARWLARSRSNDADRFVAEIAYAQSKDYVYRVMSSYRVYRLLYDENLRPK